MNITATRRGPQVTREQRQMLTARVIVIEIKIVLKDIGDLKALGLDGYGAKFSKASWSIIKRDLIAAIHEFFDSNYLYRAFNNTIVTLIPKHVNAKNIMEFRPIAGCTTFYKIISKIQTTRLGGILNRIISQTHVTFVQ